MPVIIYRSPEWKRVQGSRKLKKQCPRCGNLVEFVLLYDTETFAWIIPINRVYALKCPICVYWEKATAAVRRQLMEESC